MNSNEYQKQKDNSRDHGNYDDRDSINSKDFMIGALIGGIVGAATALFLAPKSGRELRSDLNEGAKSLSEKTDKLRQTASEKTEQIRQTASEKTAQLTQTAKVKGAELAEAAKTKTSSLSDTVSKQSANIIETVKKKKDENSKTTDTSSTSTVSGEYTNTQEKANEDQAKLKLQETEKAFAETENRLHN